MGQATDAILAYGYDLGGADSEWKLAGLSKYGELTADWWDESEDLGEDADFATALIAWIGGDVRDVGVEVVTYCSESSPMYLLAATQITVRRGHLHEVTPETLGAPEDRARWDELLDRHVAALGIRPVQERPGWLLVSYWEV